MITTELKSDIIIKNDELQVATIELRYITKNNDTIINILTLDSKLYINEDFVSLETLELDLEFSTKWFDKLPQEKKILIK